MCSVADAESENNQKLSQERERPVRRTRAQRARITFALIEPGTVSSPAPFGSGPRVRTRALGAVLFAVTIATLALVGATHGSAAAVSNSGSPPVSTTPESSVLDNEFIPQDINLSQCVSAAPRPGCGSENRSGWRQSLVLLALLIGTVLIGWRIVAGVRARDRDQRAGPT